MKTDSSKSQRLFRLSYLSIEPVLCLVAVDETKDDNITCKVDGHTFYVVFVGIGDSY